MGGMPPAGGQQFGGMGAPQQPMGGLGGLPPMGGMGLGAPVGGGGMPMGGMGGGGMGMGGGQPAGMGFGGGGQPAAAGGGADQELPQDLGCLEDPRAAAWASAKTRFRSVFGESGSPPFEIIDPQVMKALHQAVTAELNSWGALAPETKGHCGYGKLFYTLLTVAVAEDEPLALLQALQGVEQLSSPSMTLILDIPWIATAQAGWPFFGLFAQLNLRAQQVEGLVNPLDMDGLDSVASQQFYGAIAGAVPSLDIGAMAQASVSYIEKPPEGATLGVLTALGGQATVLPLQERVRVLQQMQQAFKQVIDTPQALIFMLSTRWPVWSFLHLAITPITTSA